MFGKKKQTMPTVEYNPKTQKAVLRCSICTGEQVAGLKDINTGKFVDVMVIKNDVDLDKFMKMYNLSSVAKEY